ncbi:MAG: hypothetical protein K8R99_01230 [Actinomycetia bacterium]|nr:hypothetical protein [Actinomycetes bacterium]
MDGGLRPADSDVGSYRGGNFVLTPIATGIETQSASATGTDGAAPTGFQEGLIAAFAQAEQPTAETDDSATTDVAGAAGVAGAATVVSACACCSVATPPATTIAMPFDLAQVGKPNEPAIDDTAIDDTALNDTALAQSGDEPIVKQPVAASTNQNAAEPKSAVSLALAQAGNAAENLANSPRGGGKSDTEKSPLRPVGVPRLVSGDVVLDPSTLASDSAQAKDIAAPAPAAAPTRSLGMVAVDRVQVARAQAPSREVQRLAIDLDDARVALRFHGDQVKVNVVSDPSGSLDPVWSRQVERSLISAARAADESTSAFSQDPRERAASGSRDHGSPTHQPHQGDDNARDRADYERDSAYKNAFGYQLHTHLGHRLAI